MTLGRSIRIYLDGGSVSGIRHAELANWTGQALLCPRSRVAELANWQTVARRPGVYFLLNMDQGAMPGVYIGESEDVSERIRQQLREQDFWAEALLFTSKDENLTKSHIKFLEAKLVERATAARRYRMQNANRPTQSGLPRPDVDAMEEFLLNVPLLLGVLGHRVLDPVSSQEALAGEGGVRLFFSAKEAKAQGAVTDEGFVVFKGSTAMPGFTNAMTPGWIAFKQELVSSGKLVSAGQVLEFSEDVLFSSPSAAAAVVYANNANGRVLWKAADGRSLKEIEEAQAD